MNWKWLPPASGFFCLVSMCGLLSWSCSLPEDIETFDRFDLETKSNTEIRVWWVSGAEEYQLERWLTGAEGSQKRVNWKAPFFIDSGLQPDEEYTYRVRAKRSSGSSDQDDGWEEWSEEETARTFRTLSFLSSSDDLEKFIPGETYRDTIRVSVGRSNSYRVEWSILTEEVDIPGKGWTIERLSGDSLAVLQGRTPKDQHAPFDIKLRVNGWGQEQTETFTIEVGEPESPESQEPAA